MQAFVYRNKSVCMWGGELVMLLDCVVISVMGLFPSIYMSSLGVLLGAKGRYFFFLLVMRHPVCEHITFGLPDLRLEPIE